MRLESCGWKLKIQELPGESSRAELPGWMNGIPAHNRLLAEVERRGGRHLAPPACLPGQLRRLPRDKKGRFPAGISDAAVQLSVIVRWNTHGGLSRAVSLPLTAVPATVWDPAGGPAQTLLRTPEVASLPDLWVETCTPLEACEATPADPRWPWSQGAARRQTRFLHTSNGG